MIAEEQMIEARIRGDGFPGYAFIFNNRVPHLDYIVNCYKKAFCLRNLENAQVAFEHRYVVPTPTQSTNSPVAPRQCRTHNVGWSIAHHYQRCGRLGKGRHYKPRKQEHLLRASRESVFCLCFPYRLYVRV